MSVQDEIKLSKLIGQYIRKEINKQEFLNMCKTVKANTTYVEKLVDGGKDDVAHPTNTLNHLAIIFDGETAREIWQAMKK